VIIWRFAGRPARRAPDGPPRGGSGLWPDERSDQLGLRPGERRVRRLEVREHAGRRHPGLVHASLRRGPCSALMTSVYRVSITSTADRSGMGRSRRSTPSRGEPVHMGKGGSVSVKEEL